MPAHGGSGCQLGLRGDQRFLKGARDESTIGAEPWLLSGSESGYKVPTEAEAFCVKKNLSVHVNEFDSTHSDSVVMR